MSMTGFLGMRGTGDWVTDQRPKNWREQILYLYPNGMAPLTAILSKAESQKVDDPEFNWWTQTIEATRGTVTGAYTDANLNVNATTIAANTNVFVKMAAADANLLVAGMSLLLRDGDDYTADRLGKVLSVVVNGANSYAIWKARETATNAVTTAKTDRFLVVGTINEEGSTFPDVRAFNPTKYNNYTQIFRTGLKITRTAQKTRLRTKPQEYQKLKKEALEQHSIEMELAFWHGIATEFTGTGGKPERTTKGLINFITGNTYAAANNISDYSTADSGFDGSFNGKTWTAAGGGIDWLNEMLERVFRYGSAERIAFCGNGALLGISRLAQAHGTVNLQPAAKTYGMKIMEWTTPFGTVYLKTHPLWNGDDVMRNQMVLFEPRNLRYRYIDDTQFYDDPDGNNSGNRVDGKAEEYLTECGLEMHHPETCGILRGVGKDNA